VSPLSLRLCTKNRLQRLQRLQEWGARACPRVNEGRADGCGVTAPQEKAVTQAVTDTRPSWIGTVGTGRRNHFAGVCNQFCNRFGAPSGYGSVPATGACARVKTVSLDRLWTWCNQCNHFFGVQSWARPGVVRVGPSWELVSKPFT
jgi:hypothetical protein